MAGAAQGNSPITPSGNSGRPNAISRKKSSRLRQVSTNAPAPRVKKKLSYLEAREYGMLEKRIAEAEHVVKEKQSALETPSVLADGRLLQSAFAELKDAHAAVDELYARWAELEEKIS